MKKPNISKNDKALICPDYGSYILALCIRLDWEFTRKYTQGQFCWAMLNHQNIQYLEDVPEGASLHVARSLWLREVLAEMLEAAKRLWAGEKDLWALRWVDDHEK